MDGNVSREQNTQKGGNSKGRVIVVICLVVIIALLSVVIVLLIKYMNGKKELQAAPQEQREVVVNKDNAEDIAKEILNASAPPDNYVATMNSTWDFADGSQSSENAYVENSTANSNDVYFDLALSETGEVIYESPIIPVGNHLDNIKLDKDLDAGSYECVMTYHLLDGEQNTLGTVKMAVTVNVAN